MRSTQKLRNRVLAWLMTASIIVSLCPTAVFAADEAVSSSSEVIAADSDAVTEADSDSTVESTDSMTDSDTDISTDGTSTDDNTDTDTESSTDNDAEADADTDASTNEGDTESEADTDTETETEADSEAGEESDTAETEVYVLMNIPYAAFYAAELNNDIEVDSVTSATGSKWSRQDATYYEADETAGGTILGISFPVVTTEDALTSLGATEVDSEDALATAGSYAYYAVSSDSYSYSKTLTVSEGTASFSAADYEADAVDLTDEASCTFSTSSNYGDYQLNVTASSLSGTIYAVILSTEEGNDYGLRQLENIWRSGSQLSWAVNADTYESHGNLLSYEHYAAMVGQTISKVTYLTSDGIYYVTLSEKVTAISTATASVEDAQAIDGVTTFTVENLPDDFEAEYSVDGLTDAVIDIEAGTITFSTEAEDGSYTLTISDAGGTYADVTASFTIYTTVYALMNIPYDEFYANELNNDVDVDTVTSATNSKWSRQDATYYEAVTETDEETGETTTTGGTILGITFPVVTTATELTTLGATAVDSEDDLATAGSYAYYVVDSDTYSYSKTLTVSSNRRGTTVTFSAADYEADAVDLTDEASCTFSTSSNYGDYQLNVSASSLSGTVYAVILSTEEGNDYGLRQLENIWRSGSQLSWAVNADTYESHGNLLSYEHYAAMVGQTISKVTYLTSDGIYYVTLSEKVTAISTATASVEDAQAIDGVTTFTVENLPDDFEAEYSVDGLTDAEIDIEAGTITFSTEAEDGSYTLTISDAGGTYADVTASFTIYTTVYALMNIPYDEFYANELNNDVDVDTVTSATGSKWSKQDATYYEAVTETDEETGETTTTGGTILGITFPVVTTAAELTTLGATAVDSEDELVTAGSYAYYVVSSDTYSYGKTMTVSSNRRGTTVSFSAASYDTEAVELDATVTFSTETNYGDYQLNVSSDSLSGTIYAVILSTEEGNDYGLRQLENIWRNGSQLSWAVNAGTYERHGNLLSCEHYAAIVGQTITKVTYYTSAGIYYVTTSTKVVEKTDAEAEAEDVSVGSSTVTVTITDLPDDYEPVFTIDGEEISYTESDGVYTLDYSASTIGSVSITISDANGTYADLSAGFTVTTNDAYAEYEQASVSLVPTEGTTDDEFAAYLAAITSVSVDGTGYSTSGRDSVTIIDTETGAVLVDATVSSGQGENATTTALFETGESYTITVSATGYPDLTFTLIVPDFADAVVTIAQDTYTYDGTAKEPAVTVTLYGDVLTEDVDYTVTYTDNVNAGTATVTVTGIGSLSGTLSTEFTIVAKSMERAEVELTKTTYIYGAKERKPGTTVTLDGVTLTKGTDYTVTYTNNVTVGIATATIVGTGNYTGTITRSYKITGQAISSVKLSRTSYIYNGSARKPGVTVKSSAGKTLTAGTDYSITYSGNTSIGTAKVTIKGKGNYTGTTIVKTFTIKPGKVSIRSVKSSAKKKLTVSWSEKSGSVRYQIAYKVKGSDTWKYKTVSTSTLKKTISGLKSGKTYQVKVRAYKSVKGKKYYGSWSSTKTVKVK